MKFVVQQISLLFLFLKINCGFQCTYLVYKYSWGRFKGVKFTCGFSWIDTFCEPPNKHYFYCDFFQLIQIKNSFFIIFLLHLYVPEKFHGYLIELCYIYTNLLERFNHQELRYCKGFSGLKLTSSRTVLIRNNRPSFYFIYVDEVCGKCEWYKVR